MITVEIDKKNLKKDPLEFKFNDKGSVWIAGGYIRDLLIGDNPSDIDFFGTDENSLNNFIKENFSDIEPYYSTKLLKCFRHNKTNIKMQVIYTSYYKDIFDCLDSFDYTICQFAFSNNKFICNPESLIHLYERKLVIHKINPKYTLDSLRRLQKYIKKGILFVTED